MEPLHTDPILQITSTRDPWGLKLTGQVDLTNETALADHLYALDRADEDHTVDLRRVTFLSFTALRLLVCFAETLLAGRRLVLLTCGPQVRELLVACGWQYLPNLALVAHNA
jgi:anti-anti-sigma regulatory factor